MFWIKDKPTEKVIVAKLSELFCHSKDRYAILYYTEQPYPHYTEDGEEIPYSAIEKWASLSEKATTNLEEEVNKYWNDHSLEYRLGRVADIDFLHLCARHFAEWQKKQDEKDLTDKIAAAYQLGSSDAIKRLKKNCDIVDREYAKAMQESAYEKGRANMKEEMMKEASLRIVKNLDSVSYFHCIAHLGLVDNDVVKLIIIKDDETDNSDRES